MPRFFLKCQNGVMTREISLNFVVGWSENSLFVGSFIHVMNHNRVLLVIYPAQSIEKGTNPRLIFVKGHQGVSHLPCVSFPPLASSTYSSKASSSSSSGRKLPRGPSIHLSYSFFCLIGQTMPHSYQVQNGARFHLDTQKMWNGMRRDHLQAVISLANGSIRDLPKLGHLHLSKSVP